MFEIWVDLLIPLRTPYPQVPVRGDVNKGVVWETLGTTDLKTETVLRSVNKDS